VLCADTTIWQIPSGLSSLIEGCPELQEPVLKRGRELIIATRSMNIQQGPYVISPSNTKVLSAHQLSLQWQGVPDASMYRVRVVPISGSEKAVCEKVESTTKVVCEDIHLTPQPVYNYKVTVQVVNDHSSKGASEGLGFTPLRDDEVARVMADSRKLQALPIPMEARTLALAYLYIGYELRADAMHKLLEERAEGNTVPYSIAAHTLLGRLAREMRLPHEAERYYTQASQLAERTQSIESQASIQEGLGYVYKELKEATKAKAWFERAQASYRQLGDKQRLQEIAEQLGRLQ
jgi:tetratricopeptide (TPR) repeat protein